MSWVRKPLCFPSVSPKFPYLYFFNPVSKKRTSLIRLGCTFCLALVAEQWSQTEVESLFTVCRLLFNFPVFRTTPFSPLLSACLQMVPSVPDDCWFNSSCLEWENGVGLAMRNGVGNLEVWCFYEDFNPVFLFPHCYPCIHRAPHNSVVF